MMLSPRLLIALSVTTALCGAVLPVFGQDAPAPLRMVTSFEIASMQPAEEGFWMQEFGVAELLMKFHPDGTNQPWLLESLELADELTWVATVRSGVTFQNGKALDADAVLDAINHQLEVSTSALGAVPEGTSLDKTGDLEITIRTQAPWPDLPGVLSNEGVFLIYDAEVVRAAGDDWATLVGAGIYTGPYEVTGLDASRMQAERFDGYWQGEPALPGLSVAFVSDPNARILAVQNGEADIALYPPIAAKPMVDAAPGINFNFGTPGTGGFMGFMNIEEPPFDDVRVRQALLKTVNYEEIANVVFGGVLQQATGLYNDSFPWAEANYVTDSEAASALLDAAGWVLDGSTRRKDGEELVLDVVIYPQQPDLVPLSGALQAQLAAIGVGMRIQSVDDVYSALGTDGVDWDLGISSEGTVSWGVTSPFLTRYLAAEGQRNFTSYANTEVHDLIAELRVTVDATRRDDILRRVQDILVSEDPYVFAFNIHKGRVVVNDAYRDYQPGFALYHVSWETAPAGTE
jgi:peptide/nickel transport system substrate-binding protein